MLPHKLQSVLVRVGLSENEARVYLSAASLGPSTVQKITGAAGVKRTTGYSVLESLKSRGFRSRLKGLRSTT